MLKGIFTSSCLFELKKYRLLPPIHRVEDLVAPTECAVSLPGVIYLLKNQTALMEVESFFIAVVRWIPINEAEIV